MKKLLVFIALLLSFAASGQNESYVRTFRPVLVDSFPDFGSYPGYGSMMCLDTSRMSLIFWNGTEWQLGQDTVWVAGHPFGVNDLADGIIRTGTTGWLALGAQSNTASGNYSVALGGIQDTVSGPLSVVLGGQLNAVSGQGSAAIGGAFASVTANQSATLGGMHLTASGAKSIAIGGDTNTASGEYSGVVGGAENQASGSSSGVLGGAENQASGSSSGVLGGAENQASGDYSGVVGGGSNTASGTYSGVVGGSSNTASARGAVVIGGETLGANGKYSVALGGYNNVSESYGTVSIGRYNVGGGTADSWVATDPLFEIGNGASSGSKANALTVYKNGDMDVTGVTKTFYDPNYPDSYTLFHNDTDNGLSTGFIGASLMEGIKFSYDDENLFGYVGGFDLPAFGLLTNHQLKLYGEYGVDIRSTEPIYLGDQSFNDDTYIQVYYADGNIDISSSVTNGRIRIGDVSQRDDGPLLTINNGNVDLQAAGGAVNIGDPFNVMNNTLLTVSDDENRIYFKASAVVFDENTIVDVQPYPFVIKNTNDDSPYFNVENLDGWVRARIGDYEAENNGTYIEVLDEDQIITANSQSINLGASGSSTRLNISDTALKFYDENTEIGLKVDVDNGVYVLGDSGSGNALNINPTYTKLESSSGYVEIVGNPYVKITNVIKLNPRNSLPTSPEEGMIYSNSTDHKLHYYNGTAWYTLDMTIVP